MSPNHLQVVHTITRDIELGRSNSKKQAKFMQLLNPEKDRLEKYCLSITGNREQAKDLVSETILQTYLKLEKIRDSSKFPQYLFRIAKRLYYKDTRRLNRFFRLDRETYSLKDDATNLPNSIDIQIMYEALSKIPLKLRQAVILHEISGFPLKEVAEIEGCSLSAVKARVMRGRQKLKELLTEKSHRKEKEETNPMTNVFIQSRK